MFEGLTEFNTFTDWLIGTFKQIFSAMAGWQSIIGYAVLFVPIVRLVFRFLHKLIHIGNTG